MPFKEEHEIDFKKAIALRFKSVEFYRKAIHITSTEGEGHEFLFVGSKTIIMDKGDQVFFKELEGQYVEEKVTDPEEVSQEDLNELRAKHVFGRG